MKNLLKADFYRLLKNKLVFVSLIIAAVLPIIIALVILGLREMLIALDPTSREALEMVLNANVLLGSSFSLTNNFGIILPVFASIIILSDVSAGTIRNKIILGYKRRQIFASHYLTTLVYCLVMIIIYAGMTALWSSIILGIGEISGTRAVSMVYYYVLGLVSFAVVSAIATSLSLLLMNNAGSILLTIGICLGLGLLVSLLTSFDYSSYESVAYFIPNFVLTLFNSKDITATMFLEGLAGSIAFGGLFYLGGTIGFAKRDLK